MRSAALILIAFLVAYMTAGSVPPAFPQGSAVSEIEDSGNTGGVLKRPFSALKYSRMIRVLPDGKRQILRQRHKALLARDAEGRIHVGGIRTAPECNEPLLPEPPPCPLENVFVFDPGARTITHWPEGERALQIAVTIKLTDAQVEQAEHLTSAGDENIGKTKSAGTCSRTEQLPPKRIGGIVVSGVRTLTAPAGAAGPIIIHEEWTSSDMKLVLRLVDGNLKGEQTTVGLEHISLSPDASLFRPPDGYSVEYRGQGKFVQDDLKDLEEWFVR